jgi:hypothetical protein
LQDRIRAFIEDASGKDVLVLNVQDPFQRLLLHGVCEVNIFSTILENLNLHPNILSSSHNLSVCSSITYHLQPRLP